MHVLVLGAGPKGALDEQPVWISEHIGKILIERIVNACSTLDAKLIFAVSIEDIKYFSVDYVIKAADPSAECVIIKGETQGAACTSLLCLDRIDLDDELLILNGNEFLDINYLSVVTNFRVRGLDAGVVML